MENLYGPPIAGLMMFLVFWLTSEHFFANQGRMVSIGIGVTTSLFVTGVFFAKIMPETQLTILGGAWGMGLGGTYALVRIWPKGLLPKLARKTRKLFSRSS